MDNTTVVISAHQLNTLIAAVIAAEAKKEGLSWRDGAAYEAAKNELKSAYAALSAAIEAAPWGAHGALFITNRSISIASGVYNKSAWVNRRLRATLHDNGYVTVLSAEEAEKKLENGKKTVREMNAKYEARLEELGRFLWRLGMYEFPTGEFGIAGWEFEEGQCGGYFRSVRKDENGKTICVSAPGAFRRAAKILRRQGPYRR